MNKGLKKVLVLGMTACIAMTSLAGCSSKKEPDMTKTLAKINDTQLTAGEVNFMLRYQQAQFENSYGQWLASMYGADDIWSVDLTGSGNDYAVTFKDDIMNDLEKMVLAEQHMADYGIEITADEKQQISDAAEAFIQDNSEETLKAMSADKANVEKVLTWYMIRSKVQQAITADVDTEVSDEEAAQETVNYVRFRPADPVVEEETEVESEAADTEEAASEAAVEEAEAEKTESADETEAEESEEAQTEAAEAETETETEDPQTAALKEEAKEKAEAFLALVTAGGDFEELGQEASADDTYCYASKFTFGEGDTVPNEVLQEAVAGLGDGEIVDHVVATDDYYYVLQVKSVLDREATDRKKDEIVEDRKSEAINAQFEQWLSESDISIDQDVFAELKFDKIFNMETEEVVDDIENLTEAETE